MCENSISDDDGFPQAELDAVLKAMDRLQEAFAKIPQVNACCDANRCWDAVEKAKDELWIAGLSP